MRRSSLFVAATLVVVPLSIGNLLHAMRPECHKCRIAVPCEGLAAALEAHGLHARTIIAANRDDAGNLRRTARIVRLEPSYAPRLRAAHFSSKVAVVWRDGPEGRLPEGAEPESLKRQKVHCYARAREHPLAALSAVIGRARV